LDLGKAGEENFVRPGNQYDVKDLDPNEKGISREEQLRRMNILANEFNFFSVDKPEQIQIKKSDTVKENETPG
jgi:hypothetical protein